MDKSKDKTTPARNDNSSLQLINSVFRMCNAVLEKPLKFNSLIAEMGKTMIGSLQDTKNMILGNMKGQLYNAHELPNVVDSSNTSLIHYIILVMELRNYAIEFTSKPLFGQVLSGNRDLRQLLYVLLDLNRVFQKNFEKTDVEKETFSKRLMKEVLIKCSPKGPRFQKQSIKTKESGISEIHIEEFDFNRQFVNAIEDQKNLKKIAGYFDSDQDNLFFELGKYKGEQHLNSLQYFQTILTQFNDEGMRFEEYYKSEFIPIHERKVTHLKYHFLFLQIKERERLIEFKDDPELSKPQFLSFLFNTCVFAIGYPYPPAVDLAKLIKPKNVWEHQRKTLQDFQQFNKEEDDAKRKKQLEEYLKPRNCTLNFRYIKPDGKVFYSFLCEEYFDIPISVLPCKIGEESNLCMKDIPFKNTIDEAVGGMHLFVEPYKEARKEEQKQDPLRLTNYSANGFSLRLKLNRGRSWRVCQSLVFEIDPCFEEDQEFITENDYSHFVYQVFITEMELFENESLDLESLVSRKPHYCNDNFQDLNKDDLVPGHKLTLSSLQELQSLNIGIINFVTKEVVEVCKVGMTFDAVKFEAKEIESGKWGIFMENIYKSENVWVWARSVIGDQKRKYWDEMKGCPVEAWATYFDLDLDEKHSSTESVRLEVLKGGESQQEGDLLSFGRQKFKLVKLIQ